MIISRYIVKKGRCMENSIAYIVDTGSDIQKETLERHQVYSVPFAINFSQGEYIEGETISREDLIDKMKDEIPTTSATPLSRLGTIFEDIRKRQIKNVLMICMGDKFSSYYSSSAVYAKQQEDLNVYVFDTNAVSFVEGMYLIRALDLEKQGYGFEEICQKLEEMKGEDTGYLRAYFGSLDNLIRGGRVKKTTGTIAKALNIHPMIGIEDGLMCVLNKIRGEKRAYKYLCEEIRSKLDPSKKYYFSLLYGGEEERDRLKEIFQEEMAQADYHQCVPLSSVVLVHSGSKVAAIAWKAFDEEKRLDL